MLLKIAWRNTWRNRKRSAIIVAAVMVGLATGIFLMAFYNGMMEQRVNTAVLREISHLQLHHPEFRKDHDPLFYLKDGYQAVSRIRTYPGTRSVTGRIVLQGMIASPAGSSGVVINGIDPAAEDRQTELAKKIRQGNYFRDSTRNELVAGWKLLKKIKAQVGHKLVLTFQDTAGNIASAAFRVVGEYRTDNTPYDETQVFVNVRKVDSLAGLQGQLNEIAVLLGSNKDLAGIQARLQAAFTGAEVLNWKQVSPELGLTVSVASQLVYVFMIIILLALSFGIVNTMLMAVLERTRETGMLLALGMSRGRIFRMFLLETLFLVAAGCPGGIGLALLAVGLTHRSGIRFREFSEVYSSFGYSDVIYPGLGAQQLAGVLILVVITTFLSALFPAWKALRTDPAQAIHK